MFSPRRIITAIIVAVAAVVLAPLAGCAEPRVRVGEREVPASQIPAELQRELRQAEDKAAASLASENAKLEAVKRELQLELARLKASNELAGAELQNKYEDRSGAILAAINAINTRAASEIEDAKARWAAAQAQADAEYARRDMLAGALQGVSQQVGALPIPGAGLLAGVLGVGGLLIGRRQAKAEKEQERQREHQTWNESQAETLQMLLALGGGNLAQLLRGTPPPPPPAPTAPAPSTNAGGPS